MFRLLRFFSITSFMAMALAGVIMFFFFREVELKNLMELGQNQNVALTRAFSNSLWPMLSNFMRESNRLDFKHSAEHPVVPLLNYTVRHLIKDLNVVKIKIYNRRGITIYSTDNAQIGMDQSRNVGIRAALEGEVISDLIHRHGFPSFDGVVENRDMISSYIPLQRGAAERVEGVFELYYDVTPVLKRMARTQAQVVAGVVFLFLGLYAVLFGIVRRSDRVIAEQHGKLQQYLEEIREINTSLEERVLERTESLTVANRALEAEIAERQRKEEELRKLTRAVEQSPASVIITDTRGRIEYVNPKFCRITGYQPQEVIGKDPSLLKSGEMSSDEYRGMWDTIARGEEWSGEFHNRKKNGEYFWESALISPIRNQHGVITHFIAVKEDITERKQAEESLRASEMRLRTIMENVVEGIITVNSKGIIESVNPGVETIFGYGIDELIGKNIKIIVPEPHKSKHDGYISRFFAWHNQAVRHRLMVPMRGELFFEREIQAERRNGEKFPLELTISHVATDNTVQFIATLRDISERKRAQRELEEARQKTFQQEKMAAVGTLAAGILHEIGNPIAAISGLVEVLQITCKQLDEDTRANLELINENIERLTGITRDVREFSMPQGDAFQMLDINGLIDSTMRLMRFDKRMRRVKRTLRLDRNLPAVYGSGSRLRQVLINLLINAADALEGVSGREPEVIVTTGLHENKALVEVEDNGSGMTPEAREHAFDAFWTSKPAGRGTGLGLSICYSILTEHQGSIEIASVPGEGTRLRLLLPLGEGEG